jgi:hypothetical protein
MTQMTVEETTLEDSEGLAEVLAITIPSEGSGTLLQLDLVIQSHLGPKTKIASSFQPSDRNLSIKMMTTTKNKKMKNRNMKRMKNDSENDVL